MVDRYFYGSKKTIAVFLCVLSSFFVFTIFAFYANNEKKEAVNVLVRPFNESGSMPSVDKNIRFSHTDDLKREEEDLAFYFDKKGSRYADEDLARAMDALDILRTKKRDGKKKITQAEVLAVWKKIDNAKNKGYVLPAEALFYKEWSVGLIDSAHLRAQLDTEIQAFETSLQVGVGVENTADNERYKNYKEQEQRIAQDIMAQYPDDEEKALEVLEQKLTALRVSVYGGEN